MTQTSSDGSGGKVAKTGDTMTGNLAMSSHKITGLTDGAASSDAAAFGQIPLAASTTPVVASPTAPTAGVASTFAKGDHTHPRYDWQAADHGLIAWVYDPIGVQTGTLMAANGTIYVVRQHIPVATTISNVILYFTTGGSVLTSGQNFAGIYQAGTLLASTADQSAAWATSGLKTMALAGAPISVAAGDIYVAFFANATTRPTVGRQGSQGSSIANVGITSTASRFGSADTGRTTSLPATLGTITGIGDTFWAAVS